MGDFGLEFGPSGLAQSGGPVATFKLDDILTPAAGFAFPTTGGAGDYDNDPSCHISSGHGYIAGDIIRTASAAIVANVAITIGTIDSDWLPAFWANVPGGVLFAPAFIGFTLCTIQPDGTVQITAYANAGAAADTDFGLFLDGYLLASAI